MSTAEEATAPSEETVTTPSKPMLPTARIDRYLRKRFGGRRVSPGVAVYATAALDVIVAEIVRSAKAEATAAKKKRIAKEQLVLAVRSHPSLGRLFRGYTFATGNKLAYKSTDLLTKADREAAAKKKSESSKKKAAASVPGVDEA